jgi:hypothetical protein
MKINARAVKSFVAASLTVTSAAAVPGLQGVAVYVLLPGLLVGCAWPDAKCLAIIDAPDMSSHKTPVMAYVLMFGVNIALWACIFYFVTSAVQRWKQTSKSP